MDLFNQLWLIYLSVWLWSPFATATTTECLNHCGWAHAVSLCWHQDHVIVVAPCDHDRSISVFCYISLDRQTAGKQPGRQEAAFWVPSHNRPLNKASLQFSLSSWSRVSISFSHYRLFFFHLFHLSGKESRSLFHISWFPLFTPKTPAAWHHGRLHEGRTHVENICLKLILNSNALYID